MTKKIQTAEETMPYSLRAVIDVGSTSIRMALAQVHEDGRFQPLETLHQSVAIGSDTFTRGNISRSTIKDAVKVLSNFSAVLNEYNIDVRDGVRAVATSAVREARNRDEFLDRVYMATGINVEVIEGTEVNRLTFLGIRALLDANESLRKNRLLVVEVGGGSTELLGLDEGRVSFAHAYRLGSCRLRETMDAMVESGSRRRDVLDEEVDAGVRQFRDVVEKGGKGLTLLFLGGEARLAARLLSGKQEDEQALARIKLNELAKLADKVVSMDVEQVVRRYGLLYEDAQALGPALQIYVKMARAFGLRQVYVCGITLRDGLLAEAASGNAWSEDFVHQIVNSARETGRRYQLDQAHADCVTDLSLTLYRALQEEHKLEYRYEVILTVAALLHDVGMFISASSHHKHSQYIIKNSELFGLDRKDIMLTALVARYHRRALPRATHLDYSLLSREERLVVNKLGAILRAADALDRSHTQIIRNVAITIKEDQVVLEIAGEGDFMTEKRALASKGKMFEQVYGRTVVMRTGRKQG
jgi:exopolyphosphatase/guanosine-5'-triphosphate,3'-diphosphate pyrophosphatase